LLFIGASSAFTTISRRIIPVSIGTSSRNKNAGTLFTQLNAERATQGTGSAEEQCAPEEGEYCLLDEKSGKLIKLTLAEKERIFLDALQVCLKCQYK
jgi:hypothetical protein